MKKKNIIKKLLSVILSAATMFSLLTLPAYAIIPGENSLAFVTADERETGYYQVDLDTQVTTYIPRSNIPVFLEIAPTMLFLLMPDCKCKRIV